MAMGACGACGKALVGEVVLCPYCGARPTPRRPGGSAGVAPGAESPQRRRLYLLLGVLAVVLALWRFGPLGRTGTMGSDACAGGGKAEIFDRAAAPSPLVGPEDVYQFDPAVTPYVAQAQLRHTGNREYGLKNDRELRHIHDPILEAVKSVGANAYFHQPSRQIGSDTWETVTTAAVLHPGPLRKGLRDAHFPSGRALMVVQVTPGGAADRGGLRVNDLIVSVAGRPVEARSEALPMAMGVVPADGAVEVKVLREGAIESLRLVRPGEDKFLFWAAVAVILEVT